MLQKCENCGKPLSSDIYPCVSCGAKVPNSVTIPKIVFSLTALFVVVVRAINMGEV